MLSALGRKEEAILCYDEALKIGPKDAHAWVNKGKALSELGRYQEAIVCYDRALEIDGRLTNAWLNKGDALSDNGAQGRGSSLL